MKLQRSILVAIIISIITVFASCSSSDRYFSRATEMSMDVNLQVDPYGNFGRTIRIIAGDVIPGYNPAREDLVGIDHYDSSLLFYNLYPTDRVGNLRLTLNRGTVYDYLPSITGDRNGEYEITDRDSRGYFGFMDQLLYDLAYYGYVDLTIEGQSNLPAGELLYLDFWSNIDIHIRD